MNSDSIFIHHRKRDSFCCIPNDLLEDKNLSAKAKGILCYLLSKPPTWRARVSDISNRMNDGESSIRSALKELRAAGYVKLEQVRAGGKIVKWKWLVSDSPLFLDSPDGDFPHLENRHLSNTDGSNTETKESKEAEVCSKTSEDELILEKAISRKLDHRTKTEKLKAIPEPDWSQIPTEQEFDDFIEDSGFNHILDKRSNLYETTVRNKWRTWDQRSRTWKPIRDWSAYVTGLEDTISAATSK